MASGLQFDPATGKLIYAPGSEVPGATSGSFVTPDELDQAYTQGAADLDKEREFAEDAEKQRQEQIATASGLAASEIQREEAAIDAKKAQVKARKAAVAHEMQQAQADPGYSPAGMQEVPEGVGTVEQPEPSDELLEPGVRPSPASQVGAPFVQNQVEQLDKQTSDEKLRYGQDIARAGQELEAAGTILAEKDTHLDAMVEMRDEHKKEADARRVAMRDAVERLGSKPSKVSPSVLNLIGIALGGWLNPGGRNIAFEMVQKKLQREVASEMEGRRREVESLRLKQGLDKEQALSDEEFAAGSAIVMAQKLETARMQLQNNIDKMLYVGDAKVRANDLANQLGMQKAQLLDKAFALGDARIREESEALWKRKLEAAKLQAKRGGRGGGSGKVGKAAGTLWNPLTREGASAAEINKEKTDRERAVYGGVVLVDPNGQAHRGLLAATKEDQKAITKNLRDYRKVRQRAQRIIKNMEKVDGFDRLTWDAFAATSEGKLIASEFTQMMVSLKDMWELGAIQKPDMFLLEGAMGDNPTAVRTWLAEKFTGTDVRRVIENFQSGAEEQLKDNILERADLIGEDVDLRILGSRVGKDIDERSAESPDVSKDPAELKATLEATRPAPAGIADPEVAAEAKSAREKAIDMAVNRIVDRIDKAGGVQYSAKEKFQARMMIKAEAKRYPKNKKLQQALKRIEEYERKGALKQIEAKEGLKRRETQKLDPGPDVQPRGTGDFL